MNVIEARNVTKIYDKDKIPVYALRGIDLDIQQGEFTAIMGPSGSGKTTLLNILGGLDRPTDGMIKIDNQILNNLSENELIKFRQKSIGFVFQSYNLIPVLTVRENTEFVMLLQGIAKPARDRRVLELLTEVGLMDKIDKRPSELSGGQQQRVAVARALGSTGQMAAAMAWRATVNSSVRAGVTRCARNGLAVGSDCSSGQLSVMTPLDRGASSTPMTK